MDKAVSTDFKLDDLNIRAVENGFVVRYSKKMTDKARAKKRAANAKKKGNGPSLDYEDTYKSEERVADSVEEVLEIVSGILKGNDSDSEFSEAFNDEDDDD